MSNVTPKDINKFLKDTSTLLVVLYRNETLETHASISPELYPSMITLFEKLKKQMLDEYPHIKLTPDEKDEPKRD